MKRKSEEPSKLDKVLSFEADLSGTETRRDERGRIIDASTDKHDVKIAYDPWGRRLQDLRDGSGVEHSFAAGTWQSTVLRRFVASATGTLRPSLLIDAAGNETRILYREDGVVRREMGNGSVEIMQYDEEGRLLARLIHGRDRVGRRSYRSTAYQYTSEGDLVTRDDSASGTTQYEVDDAHRLVGEVMPGGQHVQFWHDAANNVRLPGLEIGPDNKLVRSPLESFFYDAQDRLAERRRADGWLVRYHYDGLDLLTRVERLRPGGTHALVWEATYDAIGRRLETRGDEGVRSFYWDGDRLAAEAMPDGQFRIYQYGTPGVLVSLGFVQYDRRDADPKSGQSYYLFSEPSGMPLVIEDERGHQVWSAERVHPFGRIDVSPRSSVEFNLRWPGHYWDPETGLHYNRYRYYDPHLARYLQPCAEGVRHDQSDPIGQGRSSANLYAYCSNPLVQVDLLGTSSKGSTDVSDAPEWVRALLERPARK